MVTVETLMKNAVWYKDLDINLNQLALLNERVRIWFITLIT